MDTRDAIRLIGRYLEEVDLVVDLLRREFKREDLLRGAKSGAIPREGKTGSSIGYSFHGVGCRAERKDMLVDFDFGPGERHDGFDAWRLHIFASCVPDLEMFADLSTAEQAMKMLLEQGLIHAPRWAPSPHLLYLTEAGRKELECIRW